MAKPDTDDGWIKMAHELHAALAFADFTKAQQVVLDYVFSQSFGPAKRRVVDLSPSDLATLTGLDKGSIGHAIAGLVGDGVLVKAALCRYVFAKDYERWQKGGKPRLRPVEVAYIKGAPTRSMAFHKGSKSLAAQPTEALVNEPTGPLVNQPTALAIEPTGVGQRANESLVNEPTKSASPHTPLYGREKGEVREESRTGAGASDSKDENADPETADYMRRQAARDRIFKAAESAFGERLVRWAAKYSGEYTENADRLINAIHDARTDELNGVTIESLPAYIREKYRQAGEPRPAGREPLAVARPEPPEFERHTPTPQVTPEERAEYAKRFRLIAMEAAANAG